jgi:hypothetical protein
VPWLEGYKLQGRDAQQLWHQQQLKRAQLSPGLTIVAPAIAQTPPAVISGGYEDVRPKKRVAIAVVKLKRLNVCTV